MMAASSPTMMTTPTGAVVARPPHRFKVFQKEEEAEQFELRVPSEYKILAGGALVRGYGGLLTGSYPVSLQEWRVSQTRVSPRAGGRWSTIKATVVALYDPQDEFSLQIVSHSASCLEEESDGTAVRKRKPSPARHSGSAAPGTPNRSTGSGDIVAGGYAAASVFNPASERGSTLVGGGARASAPIVASYGIPHQQSWVGRAFSIPSSPFDRPVPRNEQPVVVAYAITIARQKDAVGDQPIEVYMDGDGVWGIDIGGVGGDMRYTFGASCTASGKNAALDLYRLQGGGTVSKRPPATHHHATEGSATVPGIQGVGDEQQKSQDARHPTRQQERRTKSATPPVPDRQQLLLADQQ